MRYIPFPLLMLLGCLTLVWAVQPARRSPQGQQLQPDQKSGESAAPTQTAGLSWTGVVSDSNCRAKHSTASDEAAHCVSQCVARGAKYVLVSSGNVFQVIPQDQLADYAGKSVTVQGSLRGDTITVTTVSPVQQRK
ncbi:MAG TPA: hypothetical protein VMX16_06755 [Terriglobia bacterium]|nr:hypothetical protein [Terriglobia bacterium]